MDAILDATDMVQFAIKHPIFLLRGSILLSISMDESLERLYKIVIDQNNHIKRLEEQIRLLANTVTTLQDDIIDHRRDKTGIILNKKLPMASPQTSPALDGPDMAQLNRARIRLAM